MISFSTFKYADFFPRLAAFTIGYNTFLISSTSLGKSSDTPKPVPLGRFLMRDLFYDVLVAVDVELLTNVLRSFH